MNALLAYLTAHCCQGQASELVPAAGCTDLLRPRDPTIFQPDLFHAPHKSLGVLFA